MSNTITQKQIDERYRKIDAAEKIDQIAANAVKILVKELGVLKTESDGMRKFLLELGFEDGAWNSSYPSQNSECPRIKYSEEQEWLDGK